jgi:hypothetical protein
VQAPFLDVSSVEHHPIANGNACHFLLVSIASRLFKGAMHSSSVPRKSAWAFRLDNAVLNAKTCDDNIGVIDLIVYVAKIPSEGYREEIFNDVLGNAL